MGGPVTDRTSRALAAHHALTCHLSDARGVLRAALADDRVAGAARAAQAWVAEEDGGLAALLDHAEAATRAVFGHLEFADRCALADAAAAGAR